MSEFTTTIEQELEHLALWRPLPEWEGHPFFQDQARNEFVDPERHRAVVDQHLRQVVAFCARDIPWYRDLFQQIGLNPTDFRGQQDLHRIPVMSRYDLVRGFEQLKSPHAPEVGKGAFISATSGSTGLPVKVLQTPESYQHFGLISIRAARWYRQNLAWRKARIRLPKHNFRTPDGRPNPTGRTATRPRWAHAGRYFHTGDEIHFNLENSRESQLEWLNRYKPHILSSFPPLLEELALLNDGQPVERLQSMVSVASTLTSAMRGRVEKSFGVPVNQGYGLNEIGKVATRCAAGRYHAHAELVHVELLDREDQPTPPGEMGRIIVTGLSNPAMPLIRYDTGDVAMSVEGPCPCGRTLPSVGEVLGRFIRYAGTPEGTRERLLGLLAAVGELPNECFVNIRQYQVRQTLDDDFEIHMVAVGPRSPEFESRLQVAWAGLQGDQPERQLRIVEVDSIERTPSGKQLDFVSEFQETEQDFRRS